MSEHTGKPLRCMCQEFHPNSSDKQRYIDLRLEGPNVTGEWGRGYRACQQAADAAIAGLEAEVKSKDEALAYRRAGAKSWTEVVDGMRDRADKAEAALAESRQREWALDRAREEDSIDHAGDVRHANALTKQAEAALAERDNRRCEDCADHEGEEPCDRFSDSFLTFMRDHCNGKPVSCCFWTSRAEEGGE